MSSLSLPRSSSKSARVGGSLVKASSKVLTAFVLALVEAVSWASVTSPAAPSLP